MAGTVIPFGPQHPVLPEPIQLSLTVEDEIVTGAVPSLGYVHRGLESLTAVKDFKQMLMVAERVCGICSTMHGLCYCLCLEELLGLAPPPRADMLRVVWAELHRVQSHLLWLGLYADSFGFESLFMQCWRIRERVMDLNEATGGNRVNPSVNAIGGMRRDLTPELASTILATLDQVEREVRALNAPFFEDLSVRRRTRGKGLLSRDAAYALGAAGPTLRGSGVAQDARQLGYAGYAKLEFSPITAPEGDCLARNKVRYLETLQAIDLVRAALDALEPGDILAKPKGRPEGETIKRVEQPRGEMLYYVRADGSKNLTRMRIRTPTFANVPPLLSMIPGCELADVPVITLSIDPCISCTER